VATNAEKVDAQRDGSADARCESSVGARCESSVGAERESLAGSRRESFAGVAADGAARSSESGAARSPGDDVATTGSARELTDVESILCGSPREVLARIVPGDPLAIRDVVADVLRAQCVFLDADRVHLRALARTARAALRFRGAGLDLRAWLIVQATEAVAEILAEDLDSPRIDPGSAFVQFARPLGLDPEAMRRGCVAFNRLPFEDRAAFFALVVADVGLDAHARASGVTTNEVGRRARRGLEAVVRANHPDLPPPARSNTRRASPAGTGDSSPTARQVSIPPTSGSAPVRFVPREEPR